jgi:hypothetical protein
MESELTESMFDPMTFGFNTMLDHHLYHKLKHIEINKFNHLMITLTQGWVYGNLKVV